LRGKKNTNKKESKESKKIKISTPIVILISGKREEVTITEDRMTIEEEADRRTEDSKERDARKAVEEKKEEEIRGKETMKIEGKMTIANNTIKDKMTIEEAQKKVKNEEAATDLNTKPKKSSKRDMKTEKKKGMNPKILHSKPNLKKSHQTHPLAITPNPSLNKNPQKNPNSTTQSKKTKSESSRIFTVETELLMMLLS
jgi:hypothetical protein